MFDSAASAFKYRIGFSTLRFWCMVQLPLPVAIWDVVTSGPDLVM